MPKKKLLSLAGLFLLGCHFSLALAANLPLSQFPLDRYNQAVDSWLSPQDPHYQTLLLPPSYQKKRLEEFYNHVFSTAADGASPWSKNFVSQVLNKDIGLPTAITDSLTAFSNEHKDEKHLGYAENFHPYPPSWLKAIAANIDISQFTLPIKYRSENRAILVKNSYARLLPSNDPYFYNVELPGQGYPFDNLQASALWAGTPVYIIGETKDRVWSLILCASFIAWVENDALATASPAFIQRWNKQAKRQLIAITHTQTPIIDAYSKKYQLTAYVGAVFPLLKETATSLKIAIALRSPSGKAMVSEALVNKEYAAPMPLAATAKNFSRLIKTLQNRPYGWGNLYFYNDCSAELQNLYTPFGIWLPRNSSKQALAGKSLDLSAEPMEKRLAYLLDKGHPLTTIVYIGGHVFMYLGNYPNPNSVDQARMAMTYQNIWGLSPKDRSRRAVIGQSVLFPLLSSYPEDPNLNSLANTKLFYLIYLDQWPDSKHPATDLFFKN